MPVYLEATDVVKEAAGSRSVLIVPCRFCPAASLAVKNDAPYIELFRRFLKTDSYERFITTMKRSLEDEGIKTTVFKSRLLHQFVLCMWTRRRRKKLLECARNNDAVVVLGCDAAGKTVRDSVESANCRVIQGMRSEGIMSIQPTVHPPCNLRLELESVTPMLHPERQSQPE